MIVCVAVDDRMGMMFNKRRLSQDRQLRTRLLEMAGDQTLWMNGYSAKQFESSFADHIMVDEDFLNKAGADDYCFVENCSLRGYRDKIKKIILFKWNRRYPSDTYFDIPLTDLEWKLIGSDELAGYSHEKITVEEWEREQV